MAIRAR